jgi:hypothetical protein
MSLCKAPGLSNQAIQLRNGYTPERGSGPHARETGLNEQDNSAFYMRRYWQKGAVVTIM